VHSLEEIQNLMNNMGFKFKHKFNKKKEKKKKEKSTRAKGRFKV